MELPPDLRDALDDELAALAPRHLASVAARLSRAYRADVDVPTTGTAGAIRIVRTREEVAAYAATRLPATFAAVYAALRQVSERLPDWEPQSCLDVGAGPGTASWAAATLWPGLQRCALIEREPEMLALGQRLARSAAPPVLAQATWLAADLRGAWQAEAHDLVLAAYVLGELAPEQRATLVQRLWTLTRGVLVLVEPGTPPGFARIRQARDQLLAADGHTIAPCPHDRPCPMPASNWCHFAQRVARSRLHRQIKGGELGYEDEKFAYAAISTLHPTPIQARVIRHPQIRPGHIVLELCTPTGLTSASVTRKDRARWAEARDLRWGSAIPLDDAPAPEA